LDKENGTSLLVTIFKTHKNILKIIVKAYFSHRHPEHEVLKKKGTLAYNWKNSLSHTPNS
jgi:hypothetical protein